MDTYPVSTIYGEGGYLPDAPNANLLETVMLERADSTVPWDVVTRDGAGTELDRRAAGPLEVPPEPAPADTTATAPAA